MNSTRWRQVEQLYNAALEQDPERRDVFLAKACREDADLRHEVASLLAQGGSTGALVDRAAWATIRKANDGTATEWNPGETVGPYTILKLLGRAEWVQSTRHSIPA